MAGERLRPLLLSGLLRQKKLKKEVHILNKDKRDFLSDRREPIFLSLF